MLFFWPGLRRAEESGIREEGCDKMEKKEIISSAARFVLSSIAKGPMVSV